MPNKQSLKLITMIVIAAHAGLKAAEQTPVAPISSQHPCPLWDGQESVADYAKKINLPPVRNIDLGNGVIIESDGYTSEPLQRQ